MVLSNPTEIFKSLQEVEISHINEICFGLVLLAPYSTATRQISRITFSIPSNTYDEAFFLTLSAIWYHLYDLKFVRSTHVGVLPLVKLQVEAYNFTKSNTPP